MAIVTGLLLAATCFSALGFLRADRALKRGDLDAVTSDEPPDEPAGSVDRNGKPGRPFWWTVSAWAFVATGLLAAIDTLATLYSRPMNPSLSPGVAYLFAGIALLTLSRCWRRVALVILALALAAGAFIGIMVAISPEHGYVSIPALNLTIPATEKPRWAATGVVLLAVVLGWPCYMLMSAKAKALFGLAKSR